jgi:hypothetical protein
MPPSHVVPDNRKQEEQEARALTIEQELSEFARMCNVFDDEAEYDFCCIERSTPAVRFAEKINLLEKQHAIAEEDRDGDGFYTFEDLSPKEMNRQLYETHKKGRKNVREQRRFALRQKLRKHNERMKKQISRQEVKPHSEEIPSDEEQSLPSVTSESIAARNAMARAATDAEPFDKDNEELSELLGSVGDAKSLIEDIDQNDQIDEWIGHLENLVILGYHLGKAQSFMDFFMAIASYAKMYTKNKSIVMELYRIINELTATCGTDDVEPQGSEWSGRDIMNKWDLFKTNTIFKKVSYLMSAAMSLTVCTTKKIEWSPLGLKLISVEAAKEQLAAVDVIDALVKTFVWMSEVGWRCFETRSLAPILYSDVKVQQYNEDCDWVLAKADAAVAGNVDDLGSFENKLNAVLKQTCVMKSAKNEGPTSLWLQKRYSELMNISEKLAAKRKNTDIRVLPLGFSIHGPTSVGKTTLGKLTMHQALAAMDFMSDGNVVDDSRILTMDMFDKYQSTWTSDILGVFMDDIGNAKSDFSKDNPHTSVIIKFFNNVAAQAIKAELNAKGVVFIDFKVGVVTTNVKDLDARCYSNCPESILRRFYHVKCDVKEEFRKKGSTMLDKGHQTIRNATSLVLDVWDLTLEEVVTYEVSPGKTAYQFKVIDLAMDDGSILHCENMGLKDYLRAIIQLATVHKAEQDSLMHKARNASKTVFCSKCKQYPEYCSCVDIKDVKPHASDMIASVAQDVVKTAFTNYVNSWMKPVDLFNSLIGFSPIRRMATKTLAKELQEEMNRTGTPLLIALTPQWLFRTRVFKKTISTWNSTAALYDLRRPMRLMGWTCLSMFGYGLYTRRPSLVGKSIAAAWGSTIITYFMHRRRVSQLEEIYLQKRDALPEYAKNIRDGKFPKGILFVATLAVGVKLIKLWNDKRIKAVPQSMTPEDIEKQPSWFGFMMDKIGWKAQPQVQNALPEHIMATCKKNLWWAEFTKPDGNKAACNVICPEKGIIWFPRHIFHPKADMNLQPFDWLDVVCYRDENRVTSKVAFIAQIGQNAVFEPDFDMVVAFIPTCPDVPSNLGKHLPQTLPTGSSVCTLLARDKDVKLSTERIQVNHGQFGHKYLSMYGGEYTSKTAQDGTCMGLVIPEGRNPVILGFHIGGNKDNSYGVMMTVTKERAERLKKMLFALPGLRPIAQSTDLPETQYGKPLLASTSVHPNAQMFIDRDENSIVDVYGSTHLRSEAKSRVIKSILSPKIEEHFHIVNQWGAPRLKPNWKAFNATLQHIINPSKMFLPSLLERARQDWLKPILEFAKDLNSVEGIAPLSDKEMVLGVPGKRFLDAIPMNTGMGFPVFGPKNEWFEEIRDGEKLVDRIPHPMVKQEMDRMMACWKRGERAYPVTTATLKDEPTPLNKEKVRVFQASAVAFGLWIRKFFLPISRIFSLCPLLSEMAVGVNAFGPQWNELMAHAEKYAPDRKILALDYKKFDVRMGGDMTYKVLQCFIDTAQQCNYTEEHIFIMCMMVLDIIHPLIDYNGTLIMVFNMNTSGNNITVYINSIAGALYLRMGFFYCCPEKESFREWVAAMTYGDDETGSVREEVRSRFNFRTYKEFLAKHGVDITLPDKSEDECDFLLIEEADFLKRQSNFIPEIGTRIGKLTEMSIFKSLHCNLKSKTETPTTVAISCIETAMHEWFAHGREVYEDRQKKMLAVCEEMELPVPAAHYTFDERVQMWKEKYGTSDQVEITG